MDYQGNFYSDANGYNAKQLNIMSSKTMASGKYTVTAADVTATKSTINTGVLSAVKTGIVVINVLRSDVVMAGVKYTFTASTGVLEVKTNSTDYVLTAGDIVNWIVL